MADLHELAREVLDSFKGRGLTVAEVADVLGRALVVVVKGGTTLDVRAARAMFLATLGDLFDDCPNDVSIVVTSPARPS